MEVENKDILDEILAILALAKFNAEPVPQLDAVPIEQRIREFLASRFGPVWYSASIAGNVLPTGQPVYVVFGAVGSPMTGKLGMLVVGENADGSLAFAAPVPLSDDEDEEGQDDGGDLLYAPRPASETEQAYLDARQCLERIIPALIEARDIVAASGRVKPRRKKRIRHELAHACEHLTMYLDQLRRSA